MRTNYFPCKCGVEPCVCDGEQADEPAPWWLAIICALCVLSPLVVLIFLLNNL